MLDNETLMGYVNNLFMIKNICKHLAGAFTSNLEKDSPVPYQTYVFSTKLLNLGIEAISQIREMHIHAVSTIDVNKLKERRKDSIEMYNETKRKYDEYIESLKPDQILIVKGIEEDFRKNPVLPSS